MMITRLKITNVDMYGFLGRDHHPGKEDLGLVVTALKSEAYYYDDDDVGPVLEEGADGSFRLNETGIKLLTDEKYASERSGIFYQYTCVTDSCRIIELLDHEVEVASVSLQDDQERPAIAGQRSEDRCSSEPLGKEGDREA